MASFWQLLGHWTKEQCTALFFLRGCKPACTGDVCFQPLKCQLSLFVLLDNKLFTLKDDALVGIL